jgi:hypothetical protein
MLEGVKQAPVVVAIWLAGTTLRWELLLHRGFADTNICVSQVMICKARHVKSSEAMLDSTRFECTHAIAPK